jgi:hypothetical protein
MRIRTVLVWSLLVAGSAVAGCNGAATSGSSSSTTAAATPSVATTAPATSTAVAVSSGPISTPAVGSAQRTAILDAVRAGLGTKSQFVVEQLYVQGADLSAPAAVADLRPVSGGSRVFVAVTGGPSAWKLAWSAPFGSSGANVKALLGAAPGVSPELVRKLVWDLKPASGPSSAAMMTSWRLFATKQVNHFAGSGYTSGFTFTFKVAKDKQGRWWGNALGQPKKSGLESIGLWGRYKNGAWTGQIADFSDPHLDAKFFPADILAKIRI